MVCLSIAHCMERGLILSFLLCNVCVTETTLMDSGIFFKLNLTVPEQLNYAAHHAIRDIFTSHICFILWQKCVESLSATLYWLLSSGFFFLGGTEQSTTSRTRASQRDTDSCHWEFGMAKNGSLRPRTGTTTPHAHSATQLAPTTVTYQGQDSATQIWTAMSETLWWEPSTGKSTIYLSWQCFCFFFSMGILAWIATTGNCRPHRTDGPLQTAAGASLAGQQTTEKDPGNGQPSTSDESSCTTTVLPHSTI